MTKTRTTLIAAAAAAALSLPLAAAAQGTTSAQTPPPNTATPSTATAPTTGAARDRGTAAAKTPPAAIRATTLIGKDVVNSKGENLGEVQDLAIDLAHDRVHYAMLDMQGKYFAYPMRTLKLSANGENVVLNVPESAIEKAPGMDRKAWDRRAETGAAADNQRYWGDVDKYWSSVGDKSAAAPSGTVKVQPRQDMKLVWASKMVGWNIENKNGDGIGEVKDLAVRPSDGKVLFAAVDFNDKLGGSDKALWDKDLHPVPVDAFTTKDGKDDLVLQVDRASLKGAHSFDDEAFDKDLANRGWVDKAAAYADALTK